MNKQLIITILVVTNLISICFLWINQYRKSFKIGTNASIELDRRETGRLYRLKLHLNEDVFELGFDLNNELVTHSYIVDNVPASSISYTTNGSIYFVNTNLREKSTPSYVFDYSGVLHAEWPRPIGNEKTEMKVLTKPLRGPVNLPKTE